MRLHLAIQIGCGRPAVSYSLLSFLCSLLKAPLLALTLLMLGVVADYHNLTVALDNLALFTHFLY